LLGPRQKHRRLQQIIAAKLSSGSGSATAEFLRFAVLGWLATALKLVRALRFRPQIWIGGVSAVVLVVWIRVGRFARAVVVRHRSRCDRQLQLPTWVLIVERLMGVAYVQ